MKNYLLLVCLFVFVNAALCRSVEKDEDDDYDYAVIDFIVGKFNYDLYRNFKKITEEKCPNIEEELNKKFAEIHEFVEKLDMTEKTLCQSFQENYEIRVKSLVNIISPCLPEESQDIPQLVAKAMGAFIKEACHSTLEQLLVNAALCRSAEKDEDDDYDANYAVIDFIRGKFNNHLYDSFKKTAKDVKEKCPNIEEELNKKFDEIREFAEKLDMSEKTLCQSFQENYEIRVKPFVNIVSPCLPEESGDIPQLAAKAVGAFFEEACHSTLEQLLEIINPCQFKKPFKEVKPCNDLKQAIDGFTGKYPSSSFVCSLIPLGKSCSKERHDASCKNPISKSAFTHFYDKVDDATRPLCNKNNVV